MRQLEKKFALETKILLSYDFDSYAVNGLPSTVSSYYTL